MQHKLKIMPYFFSEVLYGFKKFEIRYLDRDYKVGDHLLLQEFDGDVYTGNEVLVKITYILKDAPDYGLKNGWGIFSINKV
jgi:hypothetical protein